MLSVATGEQLHLMTINTLTQKVREPRLMVLSGKGGIEHGWTAAHHKNVGNVHDMEQKPSALTLGTSMAMVSCNCSPFVCCYRQATTYPRTLGEKHGAVGQRFR